MYNNFLPSSMSGHQGIVSAANTANDRLNTINFADNPTSTHLGQPLNASPGNFGKTQIYNEKSRHIKKDSYAN